VTPQRDGRPDAVAPGERARPNDRGSGRLAGFAVGAAAGLATLEFPPVGWLVVVAFVLGAVVARRALSGVGAMLSAMGVVWLTLLTANGGSGDLAGWVVTGAAILASGVGLLAIDTRGTQ
jgi:hypothetical protein